jgi:hypothetical protein
MKCANPDFDRYGGPDVMNLREVRVPELLRGSVLDPRIGYLLLSTKVRTSIHVCEVPNAYSLESRIHIRS